MHRLKKPPLLQRLLPYFILSLSLVTGALSLQPLSNFIQERLRSFQNELLGILQNSSGMTVRYERLNPSILLQAELTGVELVRKDGTVFLKSSKAIVGYNIFDFLFGQPLKALNTVHLVNTELNFDQDKDGSLFGLNGTTSVPETQFDLRQVLDKIGDSLLPGVVFRFENTSLKAHVNQNQVELAFSNAELAASSDNLNLNLAVDLKTQDFFKEFSNDLVQGRLRLEGTYFRKNRDIQAKVSLDRLRTPWGTVAAQSFAMVLSGDRVSLRKIEDQQAFDLGLNYDLSKKKLDLSLVADAWRPGLVFSPTVDVPPLLKVLLDSSFKANAKVAYDFESGLADYSFNIDGKGSYQPFGPVTLKAQGQGKNSALRLDSAAITAPGIDLAYSGVLAIKDLSHEVTDTDLTGKGRLSFSGTGPLLPFPLSLNAFVSGGISGLSVENLNANIAGYPIYAQLLSVKLSNDSLELLTDAKVPGNNTNDGGLLHLAAKTSIGAQASFEFSPQFNNVDARSLSQVVEKLAGVGTDGADPASWTVIPTNSRLNGSAFVSWHASAGSGEATGLVKELSENVVLSLDKLSLSEPGVASALAEFSIHLEQGNLEISKAQISTSQIKVAIAGNAVFDAEQKISSNLTLSSPGFAPYQVKLTVDSQGSFQVQGGSGLYADGLFSDGSVTGFAKIEALPVPVLGPKTSFSGSADFSFAGINDWHVVLRNLSLDNVNYNPLNSRRLAKLSIAKADVGAEGIQSDNVLLVDAFSAFSGNLEIGYDMQKLDGISWNMNLAANQPTAALLSDREVIRSVGTLSGDNVSVSVDISNSPIVRFVDAGMRGGFNAHVAVDGSVLSPAVSGNVSLQRAFLNQDPLAFAAQFGFDKGVFSVSNAEGQLWDNRLQLKNFKLDMAQGILSATALLNQVRQPRPQDTRLSLDVAWPSKAFSGFEGLGGRLNIDKMPGLDGSLSNYNIGVSGDTEAIYFTESVNRSIAGFLKQDGSFAFQVKAPFPFQATAQGKFAQGRIDVNVTDISVPLWPVTKPFMNSYFTLFEGNLNGSVRLVGDLNDPDFYGSLKATKVKSHLELTPDVIESDVAYLVFEEKQVRLLPFTAKAGRVTVKIEAEFALNRWLPQSYAVSVTVRDSPGLHVSSDFSNIGVDGYATGNVVVSIANDTIDIRGKLGVDQTSLWMAPTPVVQSAGSSSNNFRYVVNLDFTTGKAVEFVWPLREFPIFKSNLELGQTATLSLNQNAGTYKFTGNVNARGGELTSLKRDFFVREASIAFNEDNVKGFDPIVNARAELRTFDDGGKPVKVYAILENTHLSNMVPRFESDPPMSLNKISSILTGDIGNGETGAVSNPLSLISETGQAAISQLTQFRSLESLIKSTFGMAQFSLRTNLIGQLASDLVSTLLPVGAEQPLDSNTASLGKYIDNTTMVAGWYLGTDVYIEAMLQLKSETGALSDPNNLLGLKPYFELNMEWNTPFFLLNWNFAPKDVRRLLLDNTLTFTWRL